MRWTPAERWTVPPVVFRLSRAAWIEGKLSALTSGPRRPAAEAVGTPPAPGSSRKKPDRARPRATQNESARIERRANEPGKTALPSVQRMAAAERPARPARQTGPGDGRDSLTDRA